MKKIYYRLCFASVFLFLITVNAVAQQRTVSGLITDSQSNPMPGVNIVLKGTTVGTVTDANGVFSIQAADADILLVSFIGYTSEEIPVGAQTKIDVVLHEDVATLQEIVIVGYGSQDKKVVTGATVSVKSEDLIKTNSLRVEQALQGQTPGVQISSTSGQPGEAMKVRVRGAGTIGDAEPLYLVDGVPTNDISYLNPALIERVDVLKDGASAAIYGARAANGVVLITTKKGRAGSIQLSFDGYYGVQNQYKKLAVLNEREYGIIQNELALNSGTALPYTQAQINAMGKGTDWLAEAVNKNAPMQNYSLTASGGTDKSVFSTGITYFKQAGIIGGKTSKSTYDRLTFTVNSEHKLYKDYVKFGENLTYTHSNKQGVKVGDMYNNSIRPFLNAPPNYPVYGADGEFAHSPFYSGGDANPMAVLYYQNFGKNFTDKIVGDLYTEITPLKGLTFRSDFGLNLWFDGNHSFSPVYDLSATSSNIVTKATQGLYRNTIWNFDNTLRYAKTFSNVHNLELLVGMTAQERTSFGVGATAPYMTFNDLDYNHNIIDNSSRLDSVRGNGGLGQPYALLSQFGRLNYNYNEKYLLTATIRRDGSTNFGPNNKYGVFPSVSAGWVLTEESFLKGSTSWLNFLKLRASWGQNGNDRITAFGYMGTVNSNFRDYYFGSSENKSIGGSPDKIANPDLKWETSEQTNFGLEATVMSNVTIGLDYYTKTTKDWLVLAPVPAVVGTGAPYINGGTIVNKGLEIQLGFNHDYDGLLVNIKGNMAFNSNEVTAIANTEKIIHGPDNILYQGMTEMYRAEVGHPVGYFYGFQTDGIFQTEQEVLDYKRNEKLIQPNAVPGDVRFVDRTGDGVIDGQDRTKIGNPNPKVTYGLNLNLAYKGFDFSVYSFGAAGQQIAMNTRSYERYYNNYTTDILNRWHGEGTSNSEPRVTNNQELNGNHKFSDLFIHNGDYFRIKAVNVGYDFTNLLGKNKPFSAVRIYFSANNLFTFTKYPGMDPEVGFGGGPTNYSGGATTTAGAAYSWASGVDLGYYPQPRTYLVGLNIKL